MPVRRLRAVVVDDDPFFRRILGTCVQTLGWDVATMENGYQLIKYYMSNGDPFDLALLDLDMPLLDGLETARSVSLFLPDQRLVFLGDERDPDAPDSSLFLRKPIDFSLLVRFLQTLMERLGPIARRTP